MALPPIPSQASQLPRALQQQPAAHQQHHHGSAGLNVYSTSGSTNAPAVSIPRRRVSYLIPPPPESQPPPLLTLPTGSPEDIRARKRGNPNPLIVIANPDTLDAGEVSETSFDSNGNDLIRSRSVSDDNRYTRRGSSTVGREGKSGDNAASTTLLSSSMTASSSSAATSSSSRHYHSNNNTVQRHPEHTLGISALALDTSTIIENSSSPSRRKTPGGILYSGGRDGLVASWELSLPFRKRDPEEAYIGGRSRRRKRKPYLPRWAEDSYADEDLQRQDEEDNDEDSSSDEETTDSRKYASTASHSRDLDEDNEAEELLLGAVPQGAYKPSSPPLHSSSPGFRLDTTFGGTAAVGSGLQLDLSRHKERRRRSNSSSFKRFTLNGARKLDQSSLPYETRWRLDADQLEARNYQPQPSTFRQAHRGHTNWVNDIVLCNLNQTVVSASSDRMIRAWNPHDPHRSMLPAALGSHNDYVKCLTHARESGWIASGGFDRKIKIWDVMESREEPISEYDMTGSVYALASNPSGSTIVAGSPEKVVRIFDPRAGRASNPIAGLVGHADNVRALLVSEDGRHVLSASSDSTVKVWSVSMRRCLHTFTHHSDSVWSLFSSHPHLEVFYSGDRTGTVCKVDYENAGDISTEGECVILLRNRDQSRPGIASSNDGIHRIVALDDTYVWTASNSSNICRWKDIPRKAKRQTAHVQPPLTRQDTLLASTHYPASIPEHDETVAPASANPIPIMGTSPEEAYSSRGKLYRARSNSSISRDRASAAPQYSVAFAPTPFPRSSPQAGSPLATAASMQQQKPSSLRYTPNNTQRSTHSFSSSPPTQTFSSGFLASRGAGDNLSAVSYGSVAKPEVEQSGLPSQNGIPFESLVPLFTLDDPYGGTSGFALGSAVGYSASVLSLHRTSSRPMAGSVSSPFSSNNYPTPPSSGLSMPRLPLGFVGRSASPMANVMSTVGPSTSYHRPSSLLEDEEVYTSSQNRAKNEAYLAAQQEYEDRETAIDGVPLRQAPDDVIRGRSGLVRAELLNDRRTVISLDTQGEVAVWDIILGSCIGRFPKHEIRKRPASLISNNSTLSEGNASTTPEAEDIDILESIRNQIEGEAIVQSWCTVECRTGLLTVHIEQARAFDAEVYLDEAGVPSKPEYRVDQRLNLGKWVLRNIFDAFIQEESKAQIRRTRSGSSTTLGAAPSIHSNSSVEELSMKSSAAIILAQGPSHISLPEVTDPHTAGFSTALATPAMTPAVLPDQSDLAHQLAAPRLLPSSSASGAQLSPIPQSPMGSTTVPATPSSVLQRTEGDYFSRPRAVSDAPPIAGTAELPTPRAGDPSLTSVPVPASPITKVSKMSRFKSFGKKEASTPKKEASAPDLSTLLVGSEEEKKPYPQVVTGDKDSHLTPVQRLQQQLLRSIFSHPIHPPAWHETPPIRFGADLPVMIEEESHDAGAWATVFRSTMSLMLTELRLLEMTMPPWLLEFLCHGVAPHKDPVKIAFILEPHGGAAEAGLDELPSGSVHHTFRNLLTGCRSSLTVNKFRNARLSATRMLRMRKACHYVAEKLELESWKQRVRYQAQLDGRNANNTSTSQITPGLTRSSTKLSLSSTTSSYTHLQLAAEEGIEEPNLLPEDEVEILCNNEPVPLNATLAACAKFCYGKPGDVYLTYRRRKVDSRI